MSVIDSILSRLSESLVIDSPLCSRVRHKASDCSKCLDVCASDAITITRAGGKVSVDWEKCTACGECISACGNSVFDIKLVEKTQILSTVKQSIKESGEAFFACHNKQTDTIAGITTLAYADRKLMVKSVLMGAERIILLMDDCMKCRHESCLKTVVQEITAAKEIFEKAGLDIEIRSAPYFEKKNSLKKRLAQHDGEVMNRREFFSFVKNRTKKSVGEVIYSISENDEEKTKTRLAVDSEKLKRSFVNDLKALGGEKLIEDLIACGVLPSVSIDVETCKKCGVCAKICPFNVFQPEYETIKGKQHIKTVHTSTDRCTGCGICLHVCMSKSINLSRNSYSSL